jgi:ABC-2 type transport system ATP-binding protein
MQAVLRIEDLRKSYRTGWRKPRRSALNGLSLEVPRGSIMGLLGPNGAGKTTTLKAVMGLIRPDSGNIWVFGIDGITAEARGKIGFLPEQPYFDLYLTPRRLLGYYGRLAGLNSSQIQSKISHLLSLVDLGEVADLSMERYSKGMLQRIGLAQALISEPEFLVLDEPSSGLDPLGKEQVRDLLEELKRGGKTILLSSHQLSDIEEVCDGVAIINQGLNVASGSLDELLRSRDEYEITLERPLSRLKGKLPPSASWVDGQKKTMILSKKEVNAALKVLLEEGAEIGEVRQRRMTLEEFFFSRVGKGGGEGGR